MIGRTRWRFDAVTSTQDIAFCLALSGAESGTIVRANYQSAGRGRLGRSWESPANSALMFSVLLRPEVPVHHLGSLSVAVGHALCGVFTAAGCGNVALKWPNDVYINGRKVSGILVQTRLMPQLVAVIGIGINLNTPAESLPATATSMSRETGLVINPDIFFDDVVCALDQMWSNWQSTFPPRDIEHIERRLWLNGQQVTLLDADREIAGTILGIAPDGGLRLGINGAEKIIRAGEITRGPRPLSTDVRS